jgi:hypothetical protein
MLKEKRNTSILLESNGAKTISDTGKLNEELQRRKYLKKSS